MRRSGYGVGVLLVLVGIFRSGRESNSRFGRAPGALVVAAPNSGNRGGSNDRVAGRPETYHLNWVGEFDETNAHRCDSLPRRTKHFCVFIEIDGCNLKSRLTVA